MRFLIGSTIDIHTDAAIESKVGPIAMDFEAGDCTLQFSRNVNEIASNCTPHGLRYCDRRVIDNDKYFCSDTEYGKRV